MIKQTKVNNCDLPTLSCYQGHLQVNTNIQQQLKELNCQPKRLRLTWKSWGLVASRWRLCPLVSRWRTLADCFMEEGTPAEPLWPKSVAVSPSFSSPPASPGITRSKQTRDQTHVDLKVEPVWEIGDLHQLQFPQPEDYWGLVQHSLEGRRQPRGWL